VTLETVKTHVKHIIQKLAVAGRLGDGASPQAQNA
jgi:ATP/maltotriose-dependent transcriptional regulator MalT